MNKILYIETYGFTFEWKKLFVHLKAWWNRLIFILFYFIKPVSVSWKEYKPFLVLKMVFTIIVDNILKHYVQHIIQAVFSCGLWGGDAKIKYLRMLSAAIVLDLQKSK